MSQSIPTPRNGADPIATSPTRPRPWPSTRRAVSPFGVVPGFVLGATGTAFACPTSPRRPSPRHGAAWTL
jgi:hypothetical protein